MGTSLYFQVETANQKSYRRSRWWHLARVRMPQDYLLFALLAGVRRDEFPDLKLEFLLPKGLPDDVSLESLEEGSLTVDDQAAALDLPCTCTHADAERRVLAGESRWLRDGEAITNPDFHSHSWAAPDELELVEHRYRNAQGSDITALTAMIALMKSLQGSGHLSRAVYWFE